MISFAQNNGDKTAIVLSLACVIHCFLVPSFIVLFPAFFSIQLDNEFIHYLMLWLIVPISMLALTGGFINHKKLSYLLIGMTGLFILIFAVVLGENNIGEIGERGLTLIGSLIVSLAHYKNFKTCSQEVIKISRSGTRT